MNDRYLLSYIKGEVTSGRAVKFTPKEQLVLDTQRLKEYQSQGWLFLCADADGSIIVLITPEGKIAAEQYEEWEAEQHD